MQSDPTTRPWLADEENVPYLRRRLIEALNTCDQLTLENRKLRERLKYARQMLSKTSKLRVCREIKRRVVEGKRHQCGYSLPRPIRRALLKEPCTSLVGVGTGAIVLERCEYLRLAQHVKKSKDGCWLWTGSKNKAGYGVFQWDDQRWSAHRFMYTLFVRAITFGMVLDHTCTTRSCVNPEHLEEVTQGENVRRGKRVMVFPEIIDVPILA